MNGKRKRRSVSGLNAKDIQGIAIDSVLPATIGFLVGQILTKQLTVFQGKNATIANAAKIAGGIVLASQGSGMLNNMGIGIAAEGANAIVLPMLKKGGIARVNLLPPGEPSVYLSGIPMTAPLYSQAQPGQQINIR